MRWGPSRYLSRQTADWLSRPESRCPLQQSRRTRRPWDGKSWHDEPGERLISLWQWPLLLMACPAGIVGLFLVVDAGGGTLYGLGLPGFVAAVALASVARHFDRLDADRH